jgi:CBS domain-containing protein
MSRATIIALLVLGAALVVTSLLLRTRSAGRYEVKTIDLVFLVIPLLVVGLATGRLKGLDLFGVKADLSSLWTEAAGTDIASQVTAGTPATVQDAVQVVEMAQKGGMQELQRMIAKKVGALEFRLGHGGYYGPAIQTYFEALSGTSQLRAVVVEEEDGKLFAIYSAPDLVGSLRVAGEQGYRQLQDLLNSGSASAREELAKLPGFVGADAAVTTDTSKREALGRMEKQNVDILPVVDARGRFVGTVGRAKVTAGMILAVSEKLEGR